MNPFRKLLQYLNNSICDSPTLAGRGWGGGRVVLQNHSLHTVDRLPDPHPTLAARAARATFPARGKDKNAGEQVLRYCESLAKM